jgi:hypothetical protein
VTGRVDPEGRLGRGSLVGLLLVLALGGLPSPPELRQTTVAVAKAATRVQAQQNQNPLAPFIKVNAPVLEGLHADLARGAQVGDR